MLTAPLNVDTPLPTLSVNQPRTIATVKTTLCKANALTNTTLSLLNPLLSTVLNKMPRICELKELSFGRDSQIPMRPRTIGGCWIETRFMSSG